MPHPKEKKQRTRLKIIDVAQRHFSARGFAATRIEDIMLDCGLTRGGFYAHFNSKAHLYNLAMNDRETNASASSSLGDDTRANELLCLFTSCSPEEHVGSQMQARLAFLARDAGSREPTVRWSYECAIELLQRQLHGTDPHPGDPTALARVAMLLGALVVDSTIDNNSLKKMMAGACENAAQHLRFADARSGSDTALFWTIDSTDLVPGRRRIQA